MVDRMAMAIRVHQRKIKVNKNGANKEISCNVLVLTHARFLSNLNYLYVTISIGEETRTAGHGKTRCNR